MSSAFACKEIPDCVGLSPALLYLNKVIFDSFNEQKRHLMVEGAVIRAQIRFRFFSFLNLTCGCQL